MEGIGDGLARFREEIVPDLFNILKVIFKVLGIMLLEDSTQIRVQGLGCLEIGLWNLAMLKNFFANFSEMIFEDAV